MTCRRIWAYTIAYINHLRQTAQWCNKRTEPTERLTNSRWQSSSVDDSVKISHKKFQNCFITTFGKCAVLFSDPVRTTLYRINANYKYNSWMPNTQPYKRDMKHDIVKRCIEISNNIPSVVLVILELYIKSWCMLLWGFLRYGIFWTW